MVSSGLWKMVKSKIRNFPAANCHEFIIFISGYMFSKLEKIIILVMNVFSFSKALKMQDGHQVLLLAFRHFLHALDILKISLGGSVHAVLPLYKLLL